MVLGCGLGGTSLINANVCLPPDPRVFEDPCWPQDLRDDVATLVAEGLRRAEEMLKPTPYPQGFPALNKLQALEKSADYLQEKFYRPPIEVTFKDGINHVGVPQQACKVCGDCVSGCNYAAKNTLIMNYLPDAKNHGAEIYTQVAVRRIERQDGRWLVYYRVLEAGREKFGAPDYVCERRYGDPGRRHPGFHRNPLTFARRPAYPCLTNWDAISPAMAMCWVSAITPMRRSMGSAGARIRRENCRRWVRPSPASSISANRPS